MEELDDHLLQSSGLILLVGGLCGAENAVGHCRDTKFMLAPNAKSQSNFASIGAHIEKFNFM